MFYRNRNLYEKRQAEVRKECLGEILLLQIHGGSQFVLRFRTASPSFTRSIEGMDHARGVKGGGQKKIKSSKNIGIPDGKGSKNNNPILFLSMFSEE